MPEPWIVHDVVPHLVTADDDDQNLLTTT